MQEYSAMSSHKDADSVVLRQWVRCCTALVKSVQFECGQPGEKVEVKIFHVFVGSK